MIEIRARRFVIVATAIAAALAAWPAVSQATTICVPGFHAACKNTGANIARADLEQAMTAKGSDGVADTIRIAPGTFTDEGSFMITSGSDHLVIRGAGRTKTKLTTSSNGNIFVVDLWSAALNTRAVVVRDLTIVVPADIPVGGSAIQPSGDVLRDVNLRILNNGGNGAPSWPGGGIFKGGTISTGPDGKIQTAVQAVPPNGGTITVEDATIRNAVSGVVNSYGAVSVVVRRSRIFNSEQVAVAGSAGTTSVSNTLIAGSGYGSQVVAFANSAANPSVSLDHVTFHGDDQGGSHPLTSQVGPGQTGNASLTVTNSIATNYPYTYLCSAPVSPITGNASLEVSYSNMDLSGPEVTIDGDCTTSTATGNIDADPLLRDSLRLGPGSPSIDAGNPGFAGGLDLDRLPRRTDGDGDGDAVTDQGAFEFDRKRPRTKITKGPGGGVGGGVAKFSFKSNEGRATLMCRIDHREFRRCRSPKQFSGLDPGTHVFAVYAVDIYGNRDKTPARKRFQVPA